MRGTGSHHTNKATSEGHNSHASADGLDEDIFDWGKRQFEMSREGLEGAEAHQAGGHGHGADPAGLEAEVHIGEADDQTNQQTSEHPTYGEAGATDRDVIGAGA